MTNEELEARLIELESHMRALVGVVEKLQDHVLELQRTVKAMLQERQ
jgi:uncharacterized coiled-coil protein SlyX